MPLHSVDCGQPEKLWCFRLARAQVQQCLRHHANLVLKRHFGRTKNVARPALCARCSCVVFEVSSRPSRQCKILSTDPVFFRAPSFFFVFSLNPIYDCCMIPLYTVLSLFHFLHRVFICLIASIADRLISYVLLSRTHGRFIFIIVITGFSFAIIFFDRPDAFLLRCFLILCYCPDFHVV